MGFIAGFTACWVLYEVFIVRYLRRRRLMWWNELLALRRKRDL